MSVILRIVGVVNAALWFGGGVFFAFFILPGVFSQDLRNLFHDDPVHPYFSGEVAMVLFRRFFALQYICGVIGILHLAAEKLYLGRPFPKLGTFIVVAVLGLSLVGGLGVQHRIADLRKIMYANNVTPEARERATHSFKLWHGTSEAVNLLMLAGLLAHLIRVTRAEDSSRYVTFTKFWG